MRPSSYHPPRSDSRHAQDGTPGGATREYLAVRAELGKKFGLETIRTLLAALSHPERCCPSLLVAGTNGKGSVAAYVERALRASGLRTGRYTSPHLLRVNERICVGGRAISDRELDHAIALVRDTAERLVEEGRLQAHPTYFEALTAAAFVHFRRRRVEVAVLEVGLGGRLDATNASDPLASAIVSIAFDHEEFLGGSLARIAREKAGVLRCGRECVLGPLPAPARRAVAAVARAGGACLLDAMAGVEVAVEGAGLAVTTPEFRYRGLRPLAGAHQVTNLVVALRLLEAARRAGIRVALERVAPAVSRARWPGRLQWLPGRPRLLLDGAHNPAGARALAAHLRPLRPFVLLFGVMRDKRVRAMAAALFPLAAAVVLTRAPSRRAAPPAEIARLAGELAARAHRRVDPAHGLALARKLAGPAGTVVVAGSLYLVGAVLGIVRGDRERGRRAFRSRHRGATAGGSRRRRPRLEPRSARRSGRLSPGPA